MSIITQFDSFFRRLGDNAITSALGSSVPLVGTAIASTAADVAFDELADELADALRSVADPADADQLAAALNGVDGVTATVAGGKLTVRLTGADSTTLALDPLALNIGGSAIGLDIDAGVSGTVAAVLAATVVYDPATDILTYVDAAGDEVSLTLDVALALAAQANLGPLEATVIDTRGADDPELQLALGVNVATLDAGGSTAVLSGNAELGLTLVTETLGGVLPSFYLDLALAWDATDLGAAPSAAFDVGVELRSLLDLLTEMLGPVGDLLFGGAVGDILAALTDPLPIIDEGVSAIPPLLDLFDPIPLPGGDRTVNVLDLIGNYLRFNDGGTDGIAFKTLSAFAEAIGVLQQIRAAGASGRIELGSFSIGGNGAISPFVTALTDGVLPPAFAETLIAATEAFTQVIEEVEGLVRAGTASLGDPLITDGQGVSIPLLETPEKVIDILFPGLTGNTAPVTIIAFDLPAQIFKGEVNEFFNVIGPFGLALSASFYTLIDFQVGYDTAGLATGNVEDGIYLGTRPLEPLQKLPGQNPDTQYQFAPLAYLNASAQAGIGFGFSFANISVLGGPNGFAAAFIPGASGPAGSSDGRLRIADVGEGCFLEVDGRVTANLSLRLTIGFGFFKFVETITLAEATIVDFSYGCDGGASDPGFGLADLRAAGGGTDLVLHMGADAALRRIDGITGTDGAEVFRIAVAEDEGGNPVAGSLTINFTNILETYAGATRIFARDLGNGADAVIVAADVTQAVFVNGGGGDDILRGGSGNDDLGGDGGLDHLYGGVGNDTLRGGAGEDYLEGGAGADLIDGGSGDAGEFDRVSYAASGVGVIFTPDGDGFVGTGGDAEGDRLVSVEYIVGSQFSDRLFGNSNQRNILDGRGGNDVVWGGSQDDYLLGGAGADDIDGFGGRNGTSYVISRAGVQIDLRAGWAFGGDAQGDRLRNIQDLHGSAFADGLRGTDGANRLDGFAGNDTIWGRGGADEVLGDAGDDTVYAGADGDMLDGGSGRDLLSYDDVSGTGVMVNLGTGDGGGADTIALRIFVDAAGVPVTVAGNSSFEDLEGTQQNDSLTGDLRANTIRGQFGADLIDGSGGDDWLIGGFGGSIGGVARGDTLIGGQGTDWADYRDGNGVTVFLGGPGFGSTAEGDSLSGIENLRGSDGTDVLFGDGLANVIDPGLSRGAVDRVFGGEGVPDEAVPDTLFLDYSRGDTGGGMTGGFTAGPFGDLTSNGSFSRQDRTGVTLLDGVSFSDIEKLTLIGTSKADTVSGSGLSTSDFFATGGGDDTIRAQYGSDVILAQEDDDTVSYTAARDTEELSVPVFYLDGGRGVDELSIIFAGQSLVDVRISAPAGGVEADVVNHTALSGAAIRNFEILSLVSTGAGRDRITQNGLVDNRFFAGEAEDVVTPGLGSDEVNGGFDYQDGVEANYTVFKNRIFLNRIIDEAQLFSNDGDLMTLDYSSLSSGVEGDVDSHESVYLQTFVAPDSLFATTSSGTYRSDAGDVDLSFDNIERLDVTGSGFADHLEGTQDSYFNSDFPPPVSLRGDDILRGLGGDDVLIGFSGDDRLDGGDGDDILIGGDTELVYFQGFQFSESFVSVEVDTLTGGDGADTFVMGVALEFPQFTTPFFGYFYGDGFGDPAVVDSFARITDFDGAEGDTIQLLGSAAEYSIEVVNAGTDAVATRLFYLNTIPAALELVAELQGVTGFDLTADYVTYITPGNLGVGGAGGLPERAIAGAGERTAAAAAPAAAEATALSWVHQENDADDLLDALFDGATGTGIDLATDSLTLTGDARGFGVFDGDPFGLGSGIVLSTGQVEELAGPNLIDGGYFVGQDIALNFEVAGTNRGARIFRADLTALGPDLRSLILQDGGTGVGGSAGKYSGFDIDAVVLSRTYLDNITTLTGINSAIVLPKLDVFNYSAAYLDYRPGTVRATAESDLLGPLNGTVDGLLVDNAQVQLGVFDTDGRVDTPLGGLSLGDDGSLGIELTEAVATTQPLYLYVSEAGLGSNEVLDGRITASANRLKTPTDLSTDFGRPGAQDDTVSMTYRFQTVAGSTADTLVFDFALFSEELVEYAGSLFNDTFSIRLNGIELAQLSDGAAATVNTLRPSPLQPGSDDLIHNPVGTGPSADTTRTDAYTRILSFAGALQAGENTLVIEAQDVRDGLLDSGILVRAGTFGAGTGLVGGGGAGGGAGGSATGAALITFADAPVLREGEPASPLRVTLNPGRALTAAVTLVFAPGADLDLGAGAGVAVSVVVDPGDPLIFDLGVAGAADGVVEGTEFAVIEVTVASADPAFAGLSVAPLVLQVRDGANVAPAFTSDPAFVVAENITVVGTVIAADPDAGQSLAFALAGGDDALRFAIDADTGVLRFVAAPDYEAPGDVGGDNVYDLIVSVTDSGTPAQSSSQAVSVTVTDLREATPVAILIGDAPERFSRLEPTAWRDAWTDDRIEITHRATTGDAWSAINLGTQNPGVLPGSDLLRGNLGVSGTTFAGNTQGSVGPQQIDGTEALQFRFVGVEARQVQIDFDTDSFVSNIGGSGRNEAARVTFYDADGAVALRQTVDAGDGDSFLFDLATLDRVTAVTLEAGGETAAGVFVAGSLTDGGTPVAGLTSAFLVDSLQVWGDNFLI